MKNREMSRLWKLGGIACASALAYARVADAQPITYADAGTDQPATSVQSAPPPVRIAQPVLSASSPLGDSGEAVQLHAGRVAALMGFSRSLGLACTSAAPDVDKAMLERAAIRALAVRKGIVELEQREKRLRQEISQRPNDGRLRTELGTVLQSKQRLLDAAKKEVTGKLGNAAQSIGTLRASLCSELCTGSDKPTSPVNLCAFASPALAHAAAISDDESVRALATYVKHRFDAVRFVLPSKQALLLSEIAMAEPEISPVFAVADAASRVLDVQHTGLDVAAFTIGALDVGIRAVASLIVDRAKRESIVWFTRRLHEDVCGGKAASEPTYREIRSFWFPTTCALAGGPIDFMQYGDADLMRTLRGAIATDVATWHGVALGFGLGATLSADMKLDAGLLACDPGVETVLSCDTSAANSATCEARMKKQLACKAARDIRLSGARLAKSLASGANASLALYNFASDVERINAYRVNDAQGRRFFSHRLELLACAAAVPYVFQEYGDLVRQTKPGKVEESKALLLAALTNSPACFSILGRGFSRDVCGGFSEPTAGMSESICPRIDPGKPLDPRMQPLAALQASGKLEKLTTILRWANLVDKPAADLSTRWFAVVDAFRAYRLAAEEMARASSAASFSIPPIDLGGANGSDKLADAFRAAGAHAENTARLAERMPKLRVARASLVLARASLELAAAFLASTEQVFAGDLAFGATPGLFSQWYEYDKPTSLAETELIGSVLFPGFGSSGGLSSQAVRNLFVETSADIRRLTEAIETIEAVFADDWGRVVARVVAEMRIDAERSCVTKSCKDDCAKGKGACAVVATIGQYSGLFAALAFESDPDRVAAAIDAAASPGGGYRRKNVPGAFTISLGSLAGLSGGAELRFGSYGGKKETGKVPYLAAPTLTLPVGIDFTRGFGTHNLGLFVSAIDPAAYLQYDAVAGATLPGAQLVTVLAPGAWLHASVFDSPFTLGMYGVFRPGLRADASGLSVPSAHALQFGVSASVDVTLFDLFSSSASVRK